jgi:hypothetical protein
MPTLIEQVQASFAPLLGKPCWRVRRVHGSFLTFEFGEPHLEIHEPRKLDPSRSERLHQLFARRRVFIHGEWHLWIYCCDWIVTAGDERIGESSTHERMDRAANELDGQALISVRGEGGRWYFDFDLGGRLETRPYEKYLATNEQWHLYEASGYVLTVQADGSFTHAQGDERPDAVPPLDEGNSPHSGATG